MLSRGLYPKELINASLWWHGPTFLQVDKEHWPRDDIVRLSDETPERQKTTATAISVNYSIVDDLLKQHSDLNKVCRIIAYCLRFRKLYRPSMPMEFVSHGEISHALEVACKTVQKIAFPNKYNQLGKGNLINTTSKLLPLAPFIDQSGLLRVGGRLKNSELQFDACHPVMLPREHELTKCIIKQGHVRSLHAGTHATMAAVRQRFWPLALRSATRKIIRDCLTCFKARPIQSEALMGSLPTSRVTVSRPFSHYGVDYAGPIILREGKRRNARNHKAYISIFVCFATKGVHIELVSDLTSENFIDTLRRFISRRGKSACIYSDNGTAFVGANRQLKDLYDFINDNQTQSGIQHFLREHKTTWCFIPPNAPHFGGLWEAAVVSKVSHGSDNWQGSFNL